MSYWDWFVGLCNRWGNVASVFGLLASLIGFAITIWQVWRSREAAQMAEDAALKVRDAILRFDTVERFSAAITIMEEIKRLHRASAWQLLPDRYSSLRGLLITIRSSNPGLPNHSQSSLQGAIQHFSDIEKRVEKALANGSAPPDIAKLNGIVSAQIDKLSELLTAIKQEIGVEKHGR
jgi:hypothetical protein